MAVTHLPFPAVVGFPDLCPRCAYDLTGSAGRERCPECGLVIDPGMPCLAIACVPKRAAGPKWRRAVWMLLAATVFITLQGWPFIFAISPWLFVALMLACVFGSIAMIRTGTATKRSTERAIFATTGLVRSPWDTREVQDFHAWDGEYIAKGIPVGAAWQRIEIRRKPPVEPGAMPNAGRSKRGKKPELLLSAGLRCERDALGPLVECINTYALGETPDPEALARFADYTETNDDASLNTETEGQAGP